MTARFLIWAGIAGLVACFASLVSRCASLARGRDAARASFERHHSRAGEMIELPAHADMQRFYIDKTEVTVAAYRACVDAAACSPPSGGEFCNFGVADRDSHPVNCVTQGQAATFCAWAGRRLPSQAEWIFAACGSEQPGRPIPGEPLADKDCFGRHQGPSFESRPGEPAKGTCPVDAHPNGATPAGVLGMAGNVSEWTSSEPRVAAPARSNRMIHMGASWIDRERERKRFSCEWEMAQAPEYRDSLIGFRCARSAERPLWREMY